MTRVLLALLVLTAEERGQAAALSTSTTPTRPVVQAVRAEQPPKLDGDLSDACWQAAAKFTEFRLMELQRPLEFPTEAYLCYDEKAIYCAFYAHDPEPDRIIAQETKRSGALGNDDLVEICVDEKHQFRSYSIFMVNPLGTQDEHIAGGSARNITWKGDWRAAAKRVDDGWTAEIEIPLSILRYPKGAAGFGIFLARHVPRLNDWACFPDTGTQWDARRMLDWTDLDLPLPKHLPVWMPYSQVDHDNGGTRHTMGVDLKYETLGGITHVATLNPDFKNIEGEVESVDFSYTERFVRDRRPFFLEGGHHFPSSQIFHSTRIDDVDLAYKSFGSDLGRFSYGTLLTSEFGGDQNVVAATGYRLSDRTQSSVYLNQVYHFGDQGDNAVWDVGGNVSWVRDPARWGMMGSVSRSTDEGLGGEGWATNWRCYYQGGPGKLSGGGGWRSVSPDFSPALGFVPEKDLKSVNYWWGYGDKLDTGSVEEWNVFGDWIQQKHWQGDLHQLMRFLGGHVMLRNEMWLFVRYNRIDRRPNLDRQAMFGVGWNRRDLYCSGNLHLARGRRNGGDYRLVRFQQGFRPARDFGVNVNLEHSHIDYPPTHPDPDYMRSQLILSLNYDITPEKGLGGRLVARADGVDQLLSSEGTTNFYVTYRQAVRKGMDAFVILGDPNADKWRTRLAFKLVQPL